MKFPRLQAAINAGDVTLIGDKAVYHHPNGSVLELCHTDTDEQLLDGEMLLAAYYRKQGLE